MVSSFLEKREDGFPLYAPVTHMGITRRLSSSHAFRDILSNEHLHPLEQTIPSQFVHAYKWMCGTILYTSALRVGPRLTHLNSVHECVKNSPKKCTIIYVCRH